MPTFGGRGRRDRKGAGRPEEARHTVGKGRCGRKHQDHWEADAVR